jgi:hypothetical protein
MNKLFKYFFAAALSSTVVTSCQPSHEEGPDNAQPTQVTRPTLKADEWNKVVQNFDNRKNASGTYDAILFNLTQKRKDSICAVLGGAHIQRTSYTKKNDQLGKYVTKHDYLLDSRDSTIGEVAVTELKHSSNIGISTTRTICLFNQDKKLIVSSTENKLDLNGAAMNVYIFQAYTRPRDSKHREPGLVF